MIFEITNEQVIKYSTTCGGIVMICYYSSRSDVSFADQCKCILTNNFWNPVKVGHSKLENYRILKTITKDTILSRIRRHKAYRIENLME